MADGAVPTPRSGTADRRDHVTTFLKTLDRSQTVEELAEHFGVSLSTMRRDVDALAREARVWKIAGGSVTVRRPEPTWREKELSQRESKTAMARYAAEHLVESGDVVLLDSGTSTGCLAQVLAPRTDLTLIVAGMSPLEAIGDGRAEVIVLGGRLRRHSGSFLGTLASGALRSITPNVAFIGCDALTLNGGVNCPRLDSADFKAVAMQQSRRSWILADPTKLSEEPIEAYWAPLPVSSGIVTSAPTTEAGEHRISEFRNAGYRVEIAI